MKEENAKYLLEKFPHFFDTFTKRYPGRAHHQFSIGDGWYGIIFDCLCELQRLYEDSDVYIKVDFVQIKEKLSTLRMYYNCKLFGESIFSKWFRAVNEFIRTKMCKYGFYKAYWWMFRFRRKYIYETLYEKVGSIISYAEAQSGKVCEVCGAPGKRVAIGWWINTLCEKHKKEYEEKEKEENG